jgi:hypothetical protein
LVVWSDNLDGIIPLCRDFEDNLIKLVWSRRHSLTSLTPGPSIAGASTPPGGGGGAGSHTPATNSASSDVDINEKPRETESPVATPEPESSAPKPISGGSLWGWRIGSKAKRAPAPRDLERGGRSARPTRYFAPVYGGLGLALSTCKPFFFQTWVTPIAFVLTGYHILLDFIGSGISMLLQEWRLTNDYKRFALLATTPFLFCVSLVCTMFPLRLRMSAQCWSTVFRSASDH